jgi:hypothetical protein
MRKVVGCLAVVVAAATTFVGTLIAYFVLRLFLSEWLGWGLEILLAVGFFLVWYWGGYFLSSLLLLATQENR